MSDNLPLKRQEAALDFTNAEVTKTLKATVAIGTTDAEFQMFIGMCKGTGLNPFKKEIWCIKTPGKKYQDQQGNWKQGDDKVQMMTGINGFFTIANSNPGFDGFESGLIDPNGEFVRASYPKEDFIGAWCKVYRKDRRIPTESIAMLKEYDKSKDANYSKFGIWNKMRRIMIIKCAESIGLRKTFPQDLNGLYTEEEMPTEFGNKSNEKTEPIKTVEIEGVIPADDLPPPSHNPDELLGFGKHANLAWKEINEHYLRWLGEQNGPRSVAALLELARREKEKPEVDSSAFDNDKLPDFFDREEETNL